MAEYTVKYSLFRPGDGKDFAGLFFFLKGTMDKPIKRNRLKPNLNCTIMKNLHILFSIAL